MRKLKRYDEMKAEIAAMPIKLSAKDKNNVSFQVRGGSPGEAYANLMHKLGEK